MSSGTATSITDYGQECVPAQQQLTSMELDELLSCFLDRIDYDCMSDFFLAYRPYVTSNALFDKLSKIYLQTQSSYTSIAAHYTRVRTFVAFRHWILNYFPDDFLLSSELQQKVELFLQCLGGVGADEISTEARIAKELRRCWDRERDVHAQSNVRPRKLSIQNPFLRERHVTLALVSDKTGTIGVKNATKAFESADTLQKHDRGIQSPAQDIEAAVSYDYPNSPDASVVASRIEVQKQTGNDDSGKTPRQLRRRPGGILKNVDTVAEVVANNRLSTMSANSTPRNFRRLNAAFSLRRNTRSTLSLQREFTQDLARLFESDHCDESQEDPATILSRTMDKLEGRVEKTSQDESANAIPYRLLPITSDRHVSIPIYDADPFTMGSRKRKRHAGCVVLADQSPTKSTSYERAIDTRLSTTNKRILSSQSFTSDTEVSIIDALGIPPLPPSMLELTVPTNKISRPRYISWIMHHNTAHLSNCLSAIEQAAFCELDWLELTSAAWEDHLTDHVQDWHEVMDMEWHSIALILARSNLTTIWIVSELVQTTDTTDRAQVLTKFIDIAQLCHDHNNFATVVQVVSALQSTAISRLNETWKSLGQDALKTWTRLCTLCDARSRYKMLKSVQDRVLLNPDASLVPCLTPYLDSIKVAKSSTSTITEKMASVAKTTKVLMNMFDRIVVNDTELNFSLLDQLVWIRGLSDEQALSLSNVCEA